MSGFWRAGEGSVNVAVKVQPRARRTGLGGVVNARLRIAVTEAPEDGRASRAACEALARALDVPGSAVSLIAGASTREKVLRVAGDPVALAARLAAL